MKKKVFREYQRAIWEAKFKEAEEAREKLEAKIEENAPKKKQEAKVQVTEPKKRGRKKSVK